MDVRGVQSHLRAELIEQVVGAPLRGVLSFLQGPEAGTIQSFSLLVSFS
jgi:hypothetical protein